MTGGPANESDRLDVVVLGGGPAGCVTARGLAQCGYRVALVSRPRRIAAVEGISERALNGLRFAGFERALDAVGARVPRVAAWNGETRAVNHEWLVDRPLFDRALREDAAAGGALLIDGAAGQCARVGGRWRIEWRRQGETHPRRLAADFLVDARGRSTRRGDGWVAGPATCALARRYRARSGDKARTEVRCSRDGWFWFARDGARLAVAQWFVSVEEKPLPPRSDIDGRFEHALGRLGAWSESCNAALATSRVEVRDAGMARRRSVIETDRAFVGDAAMAIDPLAGHGIYAAISSALALVATLHTCLSRPADAALARGFYADKLDDDFLRMARSGRDFYRLERRFADAPFWKLRAAWPDSAPSHRAPTDAPARVTRRPVSADGIIVEREVVVTADHPRGVWQIAGVPLVDLLRFIEGGGDGSDDLAAACRRRFDAEAAAVDAAAQWLAGRRLLSQPR